MNWKSVFCGAALVGLLLTPAYAVQFRDVQSHWASASIERWSGYEIVSGYGDGIFGPDDPVTRAEMAAILDRIFGWQDSAGNTFTDLSGNEWYAQSILRANAAGVIMGCGDGTVGAESPVTRQEAAVMIGRALHISDSDSGTNFDDSAQIGAWALGAVNGMSRAGLITGADDGNFYPLQAITRAEAVTILDRAITGYYNETGNYAADTAGITVVAAPNVTLQNMTVDGDLILAPGADAGEVILKNVTVTGHTYIQTGSKTQVVLSGSDLKQISVEGTGAAVGLQDGTVFTQLTVKGDQSEIGGLEELAQVVVAEGTEGVILNGRSVEPGAMTADEDVSTDDDGVTIEIGRNEGASTGENTSDGAQSSQSGVGENGTIIIDFQDLLKQ